MTKSIRNLSMRSLLLRSMTLTMVLSLVGASFAEADSFAQDNNVSHDVEIVPFDKGEIALSEAPLAYESGHASGVTWSYDNQILIQDPGRAPKDTVNIHFYGGFPDLKDMVLSGRFESTSKVPFDLNLSCSIRKDNPLYPDEESGRFNCDQQSFRGGTMYNLLESSAPVCAKGDGRYFVRVIFSMMSQGSTPSGAREIQSQRWTCQGGRAYFE